jgi:hypothetical protein
VSQQFVFANNVQTQLAAPITSATQTQIQLASSANFPAIPPGYVWALTINDAATQTFFEIVYVTGYGGNTLTVLRGQENTAARTWLTNDIAYSCATAGSLASFLNAGSGNFVQLSPATQQSGSINVSGPITGGAGTFAGINVGGALTGATNGTFSGDLGARDIGLSLAYGNTPIGGLAIRMFGASGNVIGLGPSSGLTTNGITASALAIGSASTGKYVTFDILGNMGVPQYVEAYALVASNMVSGVVVFQNSRQVIDQITSSSLTITPNGHAVDIEIPSSGGIPVYGAFVNDGNGGNPIISLPNYGSWFIEVNYGLTQSSNSNLSITFYLTGGTMTGGFLSNADATQAYNAVKWISIYGKGHTTVNNQTLSWTFSVTGGSLDGFNQPWSVRATRTA